MFTNVFAVLHLPSFIQGNAGRFRSLLETYSLVAHDVNVSTDTEVVVGDAAQAESRGEKPSSHATPDTAAPPTAASAPTGPATSTSMHAPADDSRTASASGAKNAVSRPKGSTVRSALANGTYI